MVRNVGVRSFVKIRDRTLGTIYYSCIFLITGYVVGFQLLYTKAYRNEGSVVGTTSLTLKEPSAQYRVPPSALPYCAGSGGSAAQTAPCRYYDAFDAALLSAEWVTLLTRVKETNQTLYTPPGASCAEMEAEGCAYENGNASVYFVAQPELFTVGIGHSFTVPEFGDEFGGSSASLRGELCAFGGADASGGCTRAVDLCAPYTSRGFACDPNVGMEPGASRDIMAVESLLEAAGVTSLDSVAQGFAGETGRYAGVVLLVTIEYSNLASFNDTDIRYRITADRIPGEYKQEFVRQAFSTEQNAVRYVDSVHGVRIVVQQTGQVGKLDFRVLLLTAVTSLGLLAVARSIVDFLAFTILPLRFVYSQFRTVTSPDFSLVRTLPKRVLEDFKHIDLVNPDPKVFAEYGHTVDESEVQGSFATGGSRMRDAVVDTPQETVQGRGGFFASIITRARRPAQPAVPKTYLAPQAVQHSQHQYQTHDTGAAGGHDGGGHEDGAHGVLERPTTPASPRGSERSSHFDVEDGAAFPGIARPPARAAVASDSILPKKVRDKYGTFRS